MKGTHDRFGNVTIEFNSQGEILMAPPAVDGTLRKWLVCEDCGHLFTAPLNVVAGLCETCDALTCPRCGATHRTPECTAACCLTGAQGGMCHCDDDEPDTVCPDGPSCPDQECQRLRRLEGIRG